MDKIQESVSNTLSFEIVRELGVIRLATGKKLAILDEERMQSLDKALDEFNSQKSRLKGLIFIGNNVIRVYFYQPW